MSALIVKMMEKKSIFLLFLNKQLYTSPTWKFYVNIFCINNEIDKE